MATSARDGPVCSPRVAFEKVTVLSAERSRLERPAVDCLPVTTDRPVSLKAAMWDDRKSDFSGHRCAAAPPYIRPSGWDGAK